MRTEKVIPTPMVLTSVGKNRTERINPVARSFDDKKLAR